MNVNITFLIEIAVDAQLLRTRAHYGQRRLNRLLHHLAQRAGVGQFAFARHTGGFDGQQIAADFGPRQAGHLAYAVFAIGAAVVETLYTEEIFQVIAVNVDALQIFIQQQRFHRLTAQLRQFTLKATHACFARIVANDTDNRAVINADFILFQRVTLNLFRQQMLFRNVQFFIFGIAGETNHFHTVQQRRRDVHRVRGRDKHHVGEIVIHFQIVIVERHVLFWIKHLQQRGSRIAAHVG